MARSPIYGAAAPVYLSRGWVGVLPLPPRCKTEPPKGFTGKDGADPTQETLSQWATQERFGNVALRMPEGVIGIDIDAYGEKQGAETLAALEAKLGTLPATWSTSSREANPVSGIRYYRVPMGVQWHSEAGRDIQIIQHGYRYSVAPPSVHPDTKRPYRWRDPHNVTVAGAVVPSPTDFPELPPAWVAALRKSPPATPAPSGEDPWDDGRYFTEQQAEAFCAPHLEALEDAAEGSRNNRLNDAAKVLSHFIPEFWSEEEATAQLIEVLDPEYPIEEAYATIESAFNSADDDWKAHLVVEKACGWEEPLPLTVQPDPLPVDALGPIAGPMVDAVAKSLQVPADLAVTIALPIITTAARGQAKVQVGPDWIESLAVCSVACLPSGERKSAVSRLLAGPLYEFEQEAQDQAAPRIARNVQDQKLKEERVNKLRVEAAKSGDPQVEQDFFDAVGVFQSHKTEYPPRFIADDATPEALVRLLAEQHGAIGAISAEAGLLAIIAGRYNSGNPNLEVVLQATSGDPIRVDRKGSEPVSVQNPALSLGLAIQPGLLPDLGTKAGFRNAGLLARFLWSLPEPRVGTRNTEDNPVPHEIAELWAKHLKRLAAAGLPRDNGVWDVNPPKVRGPRMLGLSPEARAHLDSFRDHLEPRLHPNKGDLAGIADWGSKLPGQVIRIAAALTLLQDPGAEQIDLSTMTDAVRLGWAFIPHALAAFSRIHGYTGGVAHSAEVLAWLTQNKTTNFTIREVYQALRGRSWVTNIQTVKSALNVLVDYGHIRLAEQPKGKQRGRPTEQYELHPQYAGGDS